MLGWGQGTREGCAGHRSRKAEVVYMPWGVWEWGWARSSGSLNRAWWGPRGQGSCGVGSLAFCPLTGQRRRARLLGSIADCQGRLLGLEVWGQRKLLPG